MKSESTSAEEPEKWLGLSRAASYLGIHPITLRRWADQGGIPVMLTPGGHRRFAMADLQRLAEARRQLRPATTGLEQNWADQAVQLTRREIVGRRDQPWLAAFGERDRHQQRELGQRLMGVMLQYVSLGEAATCCWPKRSPSGGPMPRARRRWGCRWWKPCRPCCSFATRWWKPP